MSRRQHLSDPNRAHAPGPLAGGVTVLRTSRYPDMNDKTIYHQPSRPEDPDAEYLTVQETAWIMKCSVNTIRRRLRALKRGGAVGRRLLVSRADRQALYAAATQNRRQALRSSH